MQISSAINIRAGQTVIPLMITRCLRAYRKKITDRLFQITFLYTWGEEGGGGKSDLSKIPQVPANVVETNIMSWAGISGICLFDAEAGIPSGRRVGHRI